MYCVEWNTRNANPARKSLDERRPATGRNVNPVQSATDGDCYKPSVLLYCIVLYFIILYDDCWKFDTSHLELQFPLIHLYNIQSWVTLWNHDFATHAIFEL
jgi:hypothetical protein